MTIPIVRRPEDKVHFAGLDHLRALAITLVFLYHYGHLFPHPAWINTVGKFGWTGVDLFFALSGYLIASQLFAGISAQKGVSTKTFYRKRFFRIIPAYLTVLGLYFLFPAIRERESPAPLWRYLSFTQNLGLDLRTEGTFSHAWSLCIEEQFYLLLPLTLALLRWLRQLKSGFWILIGVFFFGLFIRYFVYQRLVALHTEDGSFGIMWYQLIYYPTYARLDGLLAGVGLAAFLQYRPALAQHFLKRGNALFVTGLALLTAAYFLCAEESSLVASVVGFPAVALGYGLLVLAAIHPSCFVFKLRSKVTAALASLSYAIYLTHKFTIHLSQKFLLRLGVDKESNAQFFLCILTTLAIAFLLNRLVEKPFLKLRDRRLRFR